MHGQFINSHLSGSICFFATDSSAILQFLGNLLRGFLGRVYFISSSPHRHHVEPRVKLNVPREESFPIPLRYIDVTRATSKTLDVMLECRIDDYWSIEEDRDPSDAWTGFTRFTMLDEKPLEGYTWSGGAADKEANNIQAWLLVARDMKRHVLHWSSRCGVQGNHWKRAEKVGSSDASCNALQTSTWWAQETCHTVEQHKTKYACICKADESTRKHLEGTLHKDHERPLCRKRNEFIEPMQSCAQFIPMRLLVARDVERQVRSSSTKRKTSGSSKNRSLTTLKDCAVFVSLIQQMRSSRKPWKTHREESWKIRCQQIWIARSGKKVQRNLSQSWCSQDQIPNTHASLKPTNLRGSPWKELCIKIMKDHFAGKGTVHWTITILCTSLFLCFKQWRYWMRQLQSKKNGEN